METAATSKIARYIMTEFRNLSWNTATSLHLCSSKLYDIVNRLVTCISKISPRIEENFRVLSIKYSVSLKPSAKKTVQRKFKGSAGYRGNTKELTVVKKTGIIAAEEIGYLFRPETMKYG